MYAKKIAWRDIPLHLQYGTCCWRDTKSYDEVMANNNWSSQSLLGGNIRVLITRMTMDGQELPDPFVLMFKDRTWKEISNVAICFESQAEQQDLRYCVDWWYGEPGNTKNKCLIAIRHLGIAELTLTGHDENTAA